jgi:hypothetical protein
MVVLLLLVLMSFGCIVVAGVVVVYLMYRASRMNIQGEAVGASGLTSVPAGRDLTLSAKGITVVFAKRVAGAVWNLRWKGQEFVGETMGNGGGMQSALTYDVVVGQSSEEENPTEAGNVHDYGGKTSSVWLEAARSGTEAFTKSRMAYYYPPGEVVPSPQKARARGGGVVSDTTVSKRVSIGYRGFPNVVNYHLTFQCPSPQWFVQFEALTGYMPRAFNKIYTVRGGRAVPHGGSTYTSSPPRAAVPVIIAKDDGTAMGVYAHTAPPTPTYAQSPWYAVDAKNHSGHLPWDKGQNPAGVVAPFTKWSVVWHGGSQLKKTERIARTHVFGIALVIGSVAECASVISRLGAPRRRELAGRRGGGGKGHARGSGADACLPGQPGGPGGAACRRPPAPAGGHADDHPPSCAGRRLPRHGLRGVLPPGVSHVAMALPRPAP